MQDDRKADFIQENTYKAQNNELNIPAKEAGSSEDEILDSVVIADEFEAEEELCDLLKQQVKEELEIQQLLQCDHNKESQNRTKIGGTKKIKKRVLIIIGISLAVLLILIIYLFGTKSGRKFIYRFAGNFIYNQLEIEESAPVNTDIASVTIPDLDETQTDKEIVASKPIKVVDPRQEDYVKNFLIFGIEEIENARNTDSMMIVSINSKDNTIKLTSLLRDTYVEIPGEKPNKLNSVYSAGGADLLVNTIEQNYRIRIDGFAHINFDAFEKIVNRLGGISIELGEEEAHYLNTTNYISIRENRTVVAGMNVLNGNQALGYCRVRKCVTLGGANDDYGRTLRQRRVLNAIFEKYKSQNFINLLSIMNECLGYVTTNVTASHIENSLENIVENKITTMKTLRIPANGIFETPKKYNGVEDPLVLDWDDNVKELYKFIFLDTEEQAEEALAAQRKE